MNNKGEANRGEGGREFTVEDMLGGWHKLKRAVGQLKLNLAGHLELSEAADMVELFIQGQVNALVAQQKRAAAPGANLPPDRKAIRAAMERAADNPGTAVEVEMPPMGPPQLVKPEAPEPAKAP